MVNKLELNKLKKSLKKHIDVNKLNKGAKIFEENYKNIVAGGIRNPDSKAIDSIHSKVEGNKIVVYSDWIGMKWLEEGTKPHVILPKPGYNVDKNGNRRPNVLSWRVEENVTLKNGKTVKFGDYMYASKVNHPGIEARKYGAKALFVTIPQLKELFSQK